MVNSNALQQYVVTLLLVATRVCVLHAAGGTGKIGVDYGLNGDDLLPPKQTVALLRSKGISRVRMYDAKQEITQAFAHSGIDLMIGIPNELVPKIAANFVEAINWVTQNVAQFPTSGISAIIVGNEWLLDPSHDPSLLLPAMLNINTALATSSLLKLELNGIKVSTAHALNVLGISFPPSSAAFEGGLLSVLGPLLDFLQQTGSFFMVNVFPYFAYVEDPNVSLEFALFEATEAVQDSKTKLNYTNLFDLQLDAVYAALDAYASSGLNEMNKMERIKGAAAAAISRSRAQMQSSKKKRPRVVVGESGWPSGPGASGTVPHDTLMNTWGDGMHASSSRAADVSSSDTNVSPSAAEYSCSGRECTAASVENARTYNQNLIRHVLQSKGTPANPTTPIQAFIFALFDENLKPPGTEQHYGLFFPNGTPVYPITFH